MTKLPIVAVKIKTYFKTKKEFYYLIYDISFSKTF